MQGEYAGSEMPGEPCRVRKGGRCGARQVSAVKDIFQLDSCLCRSGFHLCPPPSGCWLGGRNPPTQRALLRITRRALRVSCPDLRICSWLLHMPRNRQSTQRGRWPSRKLTPHNLYMVEYGFDLDSSSSVRSSRSRLKRVPSTME